MKQVLMEDLEAICKSGLPFEQFRNGKFLVTGATGLIGFNLVSALTYVALYKDIALKIIALVRDEEQAKKIAADLESLNMELTGLNTDLIVGNKENFTTDEIVEYLGNDRETNLK